jgi:hypothetical protein
MIAWAICVPAERAADWTADRMASSPGDMRWRLPDAVLAPNSPPIDPASISVHPPDDEAAEPVGVLLSLARLTLQHFEGRDAIDRRIVFAEKRATGGPEKS